VTIFMDERSQATFGTRDETPTPEEPCMLVARVMSGSSTDSVVVVVSGEVDIATAPEIERVLLGALDSLTPSDLVLDVASVSFIDCFGLGVLVGVANTARASGTSVALRNPSHQVNWVRDLTGLVEVLPNEDFEIAIST
jgi:anti-sigma B factor antagonist